MIIVDQIAQSIEALNPARTCAQTKAKQYYDAVVAELRRGLLMSRQETDHIPFSIKRVRKSLGRYGNPQKYWWDMLHNTYPLVTVVTKGSNLTGKLTMVKSDIPLEVLLASNDSEAIFDALYGEFSETDDVHPVPLNMNSLSAYIENTLPLAENNKTLKNNVQAAQLIYAVGKATDGVLPQIVNHSDFGRCYYKGLNLQNTHKMVRHAALGKCWAVDINNSVFQWKMSYLPRNQVEESDAFSYTRELFKRKNAIRKELAQVVWGNTQPHSINSIKSVITAVSFGARKGGAWFRDNAGNWKTTAISEIIRDPDYLQRLYDNQWFSGFCEEQKLLDDMIYADFKANHNLTDEQLAQIKTDSGRWNRSRTISYAYQQAEAKARKILENSLQSAEVILQVHDCVYVRYEPDCKSAQIELQRLWPWATCSKERIDPWKHIADNPVHQHHIKQEEEMARQMYTCNSDDDFNNKILMRQELEHFFAD